MMLKLNQNHHTISNSYSKLSKHEFGLSLMYMVKADTLSLNVPFSKSYFIKDSSFFDNLYCDSCFFDF
jgi:hypothetical protein